MAFISVPTYVVEGDPERGIKPTAPELRSVRQLNGYVNLFDRDQDNKGELVGGPEGWVCTEINEWQLESWELNYDQLIQDEFRQNYPDAYRFLQNWSIPVDDLTYLCIQTELHKLPVAYVALKYIKEHPELVRRWLAGIE